jgi:hypothetical protein
MFNKLKDKKGTREYDEWFLNYNPIEKDKMKALKGENAKKFNEKIKDLNKFSPSYSKHKDRAKTKMRTMTRTRTPRTTHRTKTRTHKIHRRS